jgi:acetate kinase
MTIAAGSRLLLSVNSGSSSLKFGLYNESGHALWSGSFSGLEPAGKPSGKIAGKPVVLTPSEDPFAAALDYLVQDVMGEKLPLIGVVHRIVHGGDRFKQACILDTAALKELEKLSPLAPLHQPFNLDGVRRFAAAMPDLPQIGCFDTMFHQSLPSVETLLPIDRNLRSEGLRRYGFHGLSFTYVSQQLLKHTSAMKGRAILAHLGNGSSLCACRAGRSVATTMGFSALEGLMMGTRSGSLDPGVVLYLMQNGWNAAQIEDLLYKRSGLRGVSGETADMKILRASNSPQAKEAIALYQHRVLREAGAMSALLGGIDLIAFTGGIGEHDVQLRREIATALAFLGAEIDLNANAAAGERIEKISTQASKAEIWVVPTDEGSVAAQMAFDLLGAH